MASTSGAPPLPATATDARKAFVVDAIAAAISPPKFKAAYADALARDDGGAIAAFLDSPVVQLLQVSVAHATTGLPKLRLTNTPDFPPGCSQQLMLTKARPGVLCETDLPCGLLVSTLVGSPAASLLQTLEDVFLPMLMRQQLAGSHVQQQPQQHSAVISSQLGELLLDVRAGLGKLVRSGSGGVGPTTGVVTLLDDIRRWVDAGATPGLPAEAAAQVLQALETIQQPLAEMAAGGAAAGDWENALDVAGHVGDALRQVWPIRAGAAGWACPQPRMQHMLELAGRSFTSGAQHKLQGCGDLLSTEFALLKPALNTAAQLLSIWAREAATLTGDWAIGLDSGGHLWQGPAFADGHFAAFQDRLEQVIALRELHVELGALFSPEEAAALSLGGVLAPLARLPPLHVSDYTASGTAPAWAAARSEVERRLEAVEARVAQKLKQLFAAVIIPNFKLAATAEQQSAAAFCSPLGAPAALPPTAVVVHPQQLFQELRRFSRLLRRPRLVAALQSEQVALAQHIDVYLERLQQDVDTAHRSGQDGNAALGGSTSGADGRLMHGVALTLAQLAQCQAKVSTVQDVLQLLIGRSRASPAESLSSAAQDESPAALALNDCIGTAASLLSAIEALRHEALSTWEDRALAQLRDMASWKTGRLMSFDAASGHISCQVSNLLASLVRDVRQLQGLGLRVRPELSAEVEAARRFYKHGMVLQRCAQFYNSIATEMIPCQKPMMLAQAVEFEQVLVSPTDASGQDITWHNTAALDGYMKRLSVLAERLAASNRQLKHWHHVLCSKVAELAATDLLRHKDGWVAAIKEMRGVFARLEAYGYPPERQELWRQHFDFQLYKALDVQFRAGLESLHKSLTEVEVSLVVRAGHVLAFDPPLEELRLQHLTVHVQPFLALPMRMKGVSGLSERAGFFGAVARAHPCAVAKVFEACEALLAALADSEAHRYCSGWLAALELGTGDAASLEAALEEALWRGCGERNAGTGTGTGAVTADDSDAAGIAAWELNMRALQSAARDLQTLPDEVRVQSYCIRLGGFKAYAAELIKRLRDALATSLRNKALSQRQAVEDFLDVGAALLSQQPGSAEEIGLAGQQARRLVAQLADVAQLRKRIEHKNRLLSQLAAGSAGSVGGSGLSSRAAVSDLAGRWDGLVAQLQAHDSTLEAQRQSLRQQLAKQLVDLSAQASGFASRWQAIKPRDGVSGNPASIIVQLDEAARQLQELQDDAAQLSKECEALGAPLPELPHLCGVEEDMAAVRGSWLLYRDFLSERDALAHADWLSMRDQVWRVEEFLAKWDDTCSSAVSSGTTANSDAPGRAAVSLVLLREVDAYRQCLPHLKACLRGVGWEDSHWSQLFLLLGFRPGAVTKETLTLAHFLDKAGAVVAQAAQVKALDASARGESLIRKALADLRLWGLQRSLDFLPVSKTGGGSSSSSAPNDAAVVAGGGVSLIGDWAPLLSEVGNHQALVASLKLSAHHVSFNDEICGWEARLDTLLEGLRLLQATQRRWLYLQPIFGRGTLPGAAERFQRVDTEFRVIMKQLHAANKVAALAGIPRVLERLSAMAAQLEACQHALTEFLEDQRAGLPRFYFLADDDMLELLGQGASLAAVQPHLKKLFAGIHRVRCSPDKACATAMVSSDGEVVDLTAPVHATKVAEAWLQHLTAGMHATLQASLSSVAQLRDPLAQAPAQVLGLFHALSFTERAEAAIAAGTLAELGSAMRTELAAVAARDCSSSSLLQLKKQSLIIDLMHCCSVVEGLLAGGGGGGGGSDTAASLDQRAFGGGPPTSVADWSWTRQLRFYAAPDTGRVVGAMAQASLPYTWEYAGNTPKLVITPLTDRCFLTLTQALAMGFGGCPYGPAGTGKTESVKALGQALGRQVLVFNCDAEFDVRAVGRAFVGLLRCGAWGCFDEFNRLSEDVLSGVSQQVQVIQAALKQGAQELSFLGKVVEVHPAAALFVTLNPAGKGYGGRSQLPDNLQQMFRPIAMAAPDNELIAEVLLASEGFAGAKALGAQVVTLFGLAQDGLSRQQHYDWGLRTLKTTLGAAGRLLRQARMLQQQRAEEDSEAAVIVRAVCATKLPMLTFEDVRRFKALIADVFQGTPLTDASNPVLEAALREAAAEDGLQLAPQQLERMLQLQLACEQRIGVVIMGPSGSGKSTLWQALEAALGKLGARPTVHRINPKAMPRQQLLGSLHPDTHEWSDGVLTAVARRAAAQPPGQRSWIVADGDVDPEWIESLNSVLDDNRVLTLPNGERIQFGTSVNLIVESDSLAHASPATVSRCGLIYTSAAAIEPAAILAPWFTQRRPDAADSHTVIDSLQPLISAACDLASSFPAAAPCSRVAMLRNMLSHLPSGQHGLRSLRKQDVLVALARGLGCALEKREHRQEFLTQLVRLAGGVDASSNAGDLLFVSSSDDPLALLRLDDEQSGAGYLGGFGSSQSSLCPPDQRLVVTDDMRGLLAVLAPWFASQEPFLLVGPEGCGKGPLLEHCFSRLPGRVVVATVHCSALTTAASVIHSLLQVCGKPVTTPHGKCLRPDGRIVLHIKGLHHPKPDKYGTVQVAALLQQLLAHGGFYDEAQEFVRLERVHVVISAAPGSATRQLSQRLTTCLHQAVVTAPSNQELEAVLTVQLQRAFKDSTVKAAATFTGNAGSFARCMLQLYWHAQQTIARSTSTNAQARCCSMTPRDLTSWIKGLDRYDLSAVGAIEAFAAEGLAVLAARASVGLTGAQVTQQLKAALETHLGSRDGLRDGDVFTSITASERARWAAAAACTTTPLTQCSMDQAATVAAGLLKAFEREVADLKLLLTPEAVERIVALDRCLSVPAGAVLLCGPSGSGRRTLLRLVAHTHGLRWWSPNINRCFDAAAFRADLKDVLRVAGCEGSPVLLYLEERHLASDPGVLELLNCLLSAGEIPGLFTAEELARDMAALDSKRVSDPHYQGPPNSYAFFKACLRRNLRVAVSLNPADGAFAARLQHSPALTSRCSVLWWAGWSAGSLQAYAAAHLTAVLAGANVAEPERKQLLACVFAVHSTAEEQLHAAPRNFHSCVDLCARTITARHEEILQQQRHLQAGLDRLAEAALTVDELTRKAEAQRGLLEQKQAEADHALSSIQASMEAAAERRLEVEHLGSQLSESEAALQAQSCQVEAQLADVQPLIDAARAAVGGIKADHINELRSLRMPSDTIRDVLEGVLLLMGQEDTSWVAMKAFLGKRSVKEDILGYDAHRILTAPGLAGKMDKMLATKAASFDKEAAYRASQAAGPMAVWVVANLRYSRVLKQVAPLEQQLHLLGRQLSESQGRLQRCQAELAVVDEQVARLKADFQTRIREAETLRLELARAAATLHAANDLLDKLSGERGRWAQQLHAIDLEMQQLPASALLFAAFVTHLPSRSEDVREALMATWARLLGVDGFDPLVFGGAEGLRLTWQGQGLQPDDLAAHNAVAILHAVQTPLIIDPSSQAMVWLQATLSAQQGHACEVVAQHDAHLVTSLELAVRFGTTLIVSEVDAVHPLLHPLLRGETEKQGGRLVVHVGDRFVDQHPGFRLYLTTRNAAPALTPEVAPLLAVANFTVTRAGLEGMLLSLTLQREQTELESRKAQLVAQQAGQQLQLSALEEQLLQALATSSGNLLDDAALLASLNETKAKAWAIAAALEEGRALSAKLDAQRSAYRPLAVRASALFYALLQLPQLDPMYCFSLESFLRLFGQLFDLPAVLADLQQPGLEGAVHSKSRLPARIALLCDSLLELVHAYTARAMFVRHHLTLALHLGRCIHPEQFPEHEWAAFLACSAAVGSSSMLPGRGAAAQPSPAWLTPERAAAYAHVSDSLPELVAAARLQDAAIWEPWMTALAGHVAVPAPVAARLTALQQLVLFAALQPEKLPTAAASLMCGLLHLPSLQPAAPSLQQLLEGLGGGRDPAGSTAGPTCEPVLFVLAAGADPSQELAACAAAHPGGVEGPPALHEVAIGQGQLDTCLQLLHECGRKGDWLLLKNLHLAISWLPVLEKAVHAMAGRHPNFRLFLTTQPHPKFPRTLLEGCTKVVLEPAPGLKQSLMRTYAAWSPEVLSGRVPSPTAPAPAAVSHRSATRLAPALPGQAALHAQLLFGLAWLNAALQERCSYAPFGWSAAYDVSAADLRAAADVVAAVTGPGGSRPDARQLFGLLQVVYAGRLSAKQDVQVLIAHLLDAFNPAVLTSLPCTFAGASARRQQQFGMQGTLSGRALPASADKQDWLAFIATLADVDASRGIGMPANVQRAQSLAAGQHMLGCLRRLGGAAAQVDAATVRTQQLQPIINLWQQLMSAAPLELRQLVQGSTDNGVDAAPASTYDDPLAAFVELERGFGAALLRAVQDTIHAAAAGSGTPTMQASLVALLHGEAPDAWQSVWAGPPSAAAYLQSVMRRAVSLEAWHVLTRGPQGVLGALHAAGQALDISQAFRPAALLIALGQQAASMAGVAPGHLQLTSCWPGGRLPNSTSSLVVPVTGLLLQGARLDGVHLEPLQEDSPLASPAPSATLSWLPPGAPRPHLHTVTVPLHTNTERSKVLAELQLPTTSVCDETFAQQQQWVLAGVALVLRD